MDGQSNGRRAALERDIADKQADLRRLQDEHNAYMAQADVQSALACEPGRSTSLFNTSATSLRLKAFGLRGDISNAREALESACAALRAFDAQPVVLTREQCAAVDETIGAL